MSAWVGAERLDCGDLSTAYSCEDVRGSEMGRARVKSAGQPAQSKRFARQETDSASDHLNGYTRVGIAARHVQTRWRAWRLGGELR